LRFAVIINVIQIQKLANFLKAEAKAFAQ